MKILMDTIDAALVIADLIEAIAMFCRRKAVRQFGQKSQRIAQATILLFAILITAILWLSICAIKAVYQSWAEALPDAIAAFQAGYVAADAPVAILKADTAVDPIGVISPELMPVKTVSRVQQRRQQCQAAGIQWRNAHGKHKHLTMQQMQAALDRLAADHPSSSADQRDALI
jgi:hypothetical protein